MISDSSKNVLDVIQKQKDSKFILLVLIHPVVC